MRNKLEQLINCLEPIQQSLDNKHLRKLIAILEDQAQQPHIQARVLADDNFVACQLLKIIAFIPQVITAPNNHELQDFCKHLRPTKLDLPQFITDVLQEQAMQANRPHNNRMP